jgi:hypothetical protein
MHPLIQQYWMHMLNQMVGNQLIDGQNSYSIRWRFPWKSHLIFVTILSSKHGR